MPPLNLVGGGDLSLAIPERGVRNGPGGRPEKGQIVSGVNAVTLEIHSSRTTHGRHVWKCDNCGRVDLWKKNWRAFGSILDHDELMAEEIPTLCSDECQAAFDRGMKAGEIEVRRVRARGYTVTISGKRRGY